MELYQAFSIDKSLTIVVSPSERQGAEFIAAQGNRGAGARRGRNVQELRQIVSWLGSGPEAYVILSHTYHGSETCMYPRGVERLKRRLRNNHSRRGSAVLEAAFVFLPMVAITFAIMDYGVAIFVQNVLYNAVREGVRYAVTQQTNSGHQDTDIKAVVQSNSMGFLSGSSGASYISITYYNPKTLATVTGVGSNAGGNICMVSVNSFPITWFAPVWRASGKFAMSANSSDIMEAPPGGTIPSR